ncbi:MAG: S-methyl-5-thioribose-1-phosphate isomerase [Clostridiales bacterium]|nr:MAG: S-methyl-5-thioribose-1-phosphate isomerase [Clostridiales bacterium]
MISTVIPATLNKTKDKLVIIDQTELPNRELFIELDQPAEIFEAIKKLRVRGAPAIGIAAAFGLYVCANRSTAEHYADFKSDFIKVRDYLATSRPTAVNLFWALDRMTACLERNQQLPIAQIKKELLRESEAILSEDQAMGRAIGKHGLALLKPKMGILTHCNAGGIATSGYGTALAPLYVGHEQNYDFKVYADETRPLLQGSRLTAYELDKAGVDVTVICDNMVSQVMKEGKIDAVLVGCDRVAANGDAANKIGTSGVAILAKEYGIPFYVLGPTSTIDMATQSGADIEIELRDPEEIGNGFGRRTAPQGVKAYNPAFDVTEAKYITAFITEKGVIKSPNKVAIAKLFE